MSGGESADTEPSAGWHVAAAEADVTLELPEGGGPMFFRRIPPGRFRMGSRGFASDEAPAHEVVVVHPYYLGTFPVTQRQFDAWARAAMPEHEHHFQGGGTLPAENLDWHAARAFCEWLASLVAQELPGYVAALPTEVEWEYACRAGSTTEYANGDGTAALTEIGWFQTNSAMRTHRVGELQPNDWGLYDMLGNVLEWCLDPWDADAYRKRLDGYAYSSGEARAAAKLADSRADRVVRGGAWFYSAWRCRSAYRFGRWPDIRYRNLGFRVCLVPGPGGPTGAGQGAEASAAGASDRRERCEAERAGAPPAGPYPLDQFYLPPVPRT